MDLSFSHPKSNKTSKVKSPKTSNTSSFSVDTKSQKLTPFAKTSKEAYAADVTSDSEDNVLGMEDDAKSSKISPKVVLATEFEPSNINIAKNSANGKNAAETYNAGAFLAALIVGGAFGGMIVW